MGCFGIILYFRIILLEYLGALTYKMQYGPEADCLVLMETWKLVLREIETTKRSSEVAAGSQPCKGPSSDT